LADNRKLLVAYTSSLDELKSIQVTQAGLGLRFSMDHGPFEDQLAWLRALSEFVEASQDLQLVVRVHPREGANKRDGRQSENLRTLRSLFDHDRYRFTHFVWPGDPISSYDLAEIADSALIHYSSVGSELARLGVPLVASAPAINAYPVGTFLLSGATPESYFEAVRQSLRERHAHWPALTQAFRWYHFFTFASAVDVGDVVPKSDMGDLPPFRLPASHRLIETALCEGKSLTDLNRERLAGDQSPGAEASERLAIRTELLRILHFLFDGHAAEGKVRGTFRLNGNQVEYGGAVAGASRYSPLAARLLRLLAEESDQPIAIDRP
jgi:hypothetical protein